ncbi:Protein of unknown function, partial [Gryllus bimaculatus]
MQTPRTWSAGCRACWLAPSEGGGRRRESTELPCECVVRRRDGRRSDAGAPGCAAEGAGRG